MIPINKNYIYIVKAFIFSCILLFLYSIYKTNISNLYFSSLIFILIFIILTENFLSKENISLLRIITLLAFCFGFFLSCFYIFLSPEDFIGNYNNKVGNFKFHEDDIINIFTLISVGMISIYLALNIDIFKFINLSRKKFLVEEKFQFKSEKHKQFLFFCFLTISFLHFSLLFLVNKFGLFRHGLADSIILPFHLNGILRYAKGLLGFLILFMFFDIFKNEKKLVLYTIIIAFILIVFNLSISQGRFAVLVLSAPILLYYFISMNIDKQLKVLPIILIFMFLIFFGISTIEIIRHSQYENIRFLSFDNLERLFKFLSFSNFFKFLVFRIEGIKEIFIISLSEPSLNKFMTYFFELDDLKKVSESFWPVSYEGTNFGRTLGIFGMFYLSNNIYIFFFGIFFLFFILSNIEKFLYNQNLKTVSFYFVLSTFPVLWGNWTFGYISRRMIIFSIFIIFFLLIKKLFISKK